MPSWTLGRDPLCCLAGLLSVPSLAQLFLPWCTTGQKGRDRTSWKLFSVKVVVKSWVS